ncbi:adhesive plaque matrix protein-like [Neodiprion virginianus]|uniref:adhesive plaque matrix protein-like n=1 Tax=Neodiprion virginianus TaxID=2961670 RepID=UPI001EE6BDC2|nr:adhesive plaque matrix protein-like [Neodiprion virginianus]
MKSYAILALCFAVALGEKKINLEDIERDNLKSEEQSEEENVRPNQLKYNSANPESNAQYQYQSEVRSVGSQPSHEIKYLVQPEAYSQDLQAYQQQQQLLAQAPQQFYNPASYQAEAYQSPKIAPQISYQSQVTDGLSYQPEISVGNQIQSYQQKYAAQKFSQGISKGNDYTNQQLLYYATPASAGLGAKSQVQPLLHRLASQAAPNVKLPATYIPSLSQSSKISYQPQTQIKYVYEPQYVQPEKPTYETKETGKFAYVVPQAYSSVQAYSGLTYTPQSPIYTTQPKVAYTQAYYVQPQSTQYYQRPAYTPSLASQGNTLSYTNSQPFYVFPKLAEQLAAQISEQQTSHSIAQSYSKIPQEPRYTLSVPQAPAQNFKSEQITQLRPVFSENLQSNNHIHYSSGPKSLLDSYTPSNVIASQDSERYRERPLRLESGFLPSKGSYAHSYNQKRKAE